MAGREVLLEGAVGEGVDADAAGQEESGPVPEELDQQGRVGLGRGADPGEGGEEVALGDVRRAFRGLLVRVRPEGELVEGAPEPVLADLEPLGEATLDHDGLAVRALDHPLALPAGQKEVHRGGVQALPLLGKRAAAPGVEARHEGEEERALGQGEEAIVGEDGLLQEGRLALGVVRTEPSPAGHLLVPGGDEAADLPRRERREGRLLEVQAQVPFLVLVGVDRGW